MKRIAFITLGRYGDICNALPMALFEYQRGNRPAFVISEPYADLLDGVSYCDKIVWEGNYSLPATAKKWVESKSQFDEIRVAQAYGFTSQHKCSNFCEEAWQLAGMKQLWQQVPLIFDLRSKEREDNLINLNLPQLRASQKPVVLVHAKGISSPFENSSRLFELLDLLRDEYEIVDLGEIKADRFYDLLGLYERAEYLVCIDSGPLHLAQAAPRLNLITLISDGISSWYGSAPRQNHVLRIPYSQFENRKSEIVETLKLKKKAGVRIIHVWSKYQINESGARKRHLMAAKTWAKELNQCIDLPVEDAAFTRNSCTEVREKKRVPYVSDLINKALPHVNPWDIILLTNDDTCLCPDIVSILKKHIPVIDSCWSARREHRQVDRMMTTDELIRGYKHVGADVFAFTKHWWEKYGDQMPEMFLGFERWDYVLRTLIEGFGGKEIENLCYHEIHDGAWVRNRSSPAARHNQQMGGEFFNART